jgi:hypothetical protein
VKWDLWWTKWRCGRFSPSASVSPDNLHSTKFSILTVTWGRYNRPEVVGVLSGPNPPLCEFKKKIKYFIRTPYFGITFLIERVMFADTFYISVPKVTNLELISEYSPLRDRLSDGTFKAAATAAAAATYLLPLK